MKPAGPAARLVRLPGWPRRSSPQAAAPVLLVGADAAQVRALRQALEAACGTPDDIGLPPVNWLDARVLTNGEDAPRVGGAAAGEGGLSASLPARCAILVSGGEADEEDGLRRRLAELGLPYAVVAPLPPGEQQALAALRGLLREVSPGPRWRWLCPDCDDGDCESHGAQGTGPR